MAALRMAFLALALLLPVPADAQVPTDWRPFVAEASVRFGVPPPWIERVIWIESRGRTMLRGHPIVSPKGAIGLMQLMPATWARMRDALRLGSDPNDPHDNILAGTAYLRQMYDRFGYPGCFAAYNAGPNRYGDYLSGIRSLPVETVDYLARTAGVERASDVAVRPSLFVSLAPATATASVAASGRAHRTDLFAILPRP